MATETQNAGVLVVTDYCEQCGQRTKHESREERDAPHGDLYERLTCTNCGTSTCVKIL